MVAPSNKRFLLESDKGVANGLATLDGAGKVPDGQLPAAVIRDGAITVDARKYGVTADGATDDTTAWAAAVAAAKTVAGAGAVTVLAPAGTSIVSGIDLPTLVGVKGHGRGTTIKLKTGSNRPVFRTAALTTQGTYIGNLTIDGNKASQAGGISHGIHLNNQSAAISPGFIQYLSDSCHIVDDVVVVNCDGSGIKTDGRGETQINRVRSLFNTGHGFHINSFDTFMNDCSAGVNTLDGLYISMPNVQVANSKGFMNRNGLRVDGSHVKGCVVSGFVAQGNYEHGVNLIGARDNFFEVVSFDNNYGEATGGVLWSGLALNGATRNRIILNTYRSEKPTAQVAGLYPLSSTANIIDVTTDGVLPLVVSGANLRGNTVRTSSTGGFAVDTYAASYSPDVTTGNTRQITLTGNMTLNAPTGTILEGQTLTFLFTQDGTGGRALTWGSGWIQKNWQPVLGANSTSVVTWQYWGGVWVLAGGTYDEPAPVITDTFAASYTPDTSTGYLRAMTLTGSLTVNRPTTAQNGQVLTFLFTQDATGGRGITWGSGWIDKTWQPAQAANAISSVRWIYWAGNWHLLAGAHPHATAPVVDASTVDATYGAEEQAVITSLRTAVNTLTAAMKANGLLS